MRLTGYPKTVSVLAVCFLIVTPLLTAFLAPRSSTVYSSVAAGVTVAISFTRADAKALADAAAGCAEFSSMGLSHGLQRIALGQCSSHLTNL